MKTIPFTAANTYIAQIWQYPPPPLPGEKTLTVIQKPKTMPYKMAASEGKTIWGRHTEISRIAGRHGATKLGKLADIGLLASVAGCWIRRYEITPG